MAAKPALPHVIGNKIATTLSNSINDSTLTIPLSSGVGLNTSGGYIIIDKGLASEEIIYLEGVSGSTGTVSSDGRGQAGTSVASHSSGATVYDVLVDDHIEGLITFVQDTLHPVGSIYINADDDTNPGTLFGFGTWVAFGAGRMLVGLDSGDGDFDTAEETGGGKTKNIEHKHLQTAGVDTNAIYHISGNPNGSEQPGSSLRKAQSVSNTTDLIRLDYTYNAGSATQNVMNPYIVVYMWKRTA